MADESLCILQYDPLADGVSALGLVDSMGSDAKVARMTRISTNGDRRASTLERDAKLFRSLMDRAEWGPLQFFQLTLYCVLPLPIARQWMRHWSWCLAGDTRLDFETPNGKIYHLTAAQLYDRWQPTRNATRPDKQLNPFFKRERVQQMRLRCLNEETGETAYTHVTGVQMTGVKSVYRVRLSTGATVRMTTDHQCYTDEGWLPLGEALARGAYFGTLRRVGPERAYEAPDLTGQTEEWRDVAGYDGRYQVSSLGRVRSFCLPGGRGRAEEPHVLAASLHVQSGYPSVVLAGDAATGRTVHSLVAETFIGPRPEGMQVRHLNGNPLDGRLPWITYGTPLENQRDSYDHGTRVRRRLSFVAAIEAEPDGVEPVYDISVAGPWHNFAANGMIVHNCYIAADDPSDAAYNELSRRYSSADVLIYRPAVWYTQHPTDRQQAGIPAEAQDVQTERYNHACHTALACYEAMLEDGVVREQARLVLPQGAYTRFYTTVNLRSALHFVGLRADAKAETEIQAYARDLSRIIEMRWPTIWLAWESVRADRAGAGAPS